MNSINTLHDRKPCFEMWSQKMPKKSRKKARRIVKIRKNGNLLTIETLNQRICKILEGALSYTKIVQIRGREASVHGSHVGAVEATDEASVAHDDGILTGGVPRGA